MSRRSLTGVGAPGLLVPSISSQRPPGPSLVPIMGDGNGGWGAEWAGGQGDIRREKRQGGMATRVLGAEGQLGESQIPEITRGRRGGEARSARGEPASVCGGEPGEGTQVGAAGCKGPGVPKEVGGAGSIIINASPTRARTMGEPAPGGSPALLWLTRISLQKQTQHVPVSSRGRAPAF